MVTGQTVALEVARISWLSAMVGWLTSARLMTTEAGLPALSAIWMVWWDGPKIGSGGLDGDEGCDRQGWRPCRRPHRSGARCR